MKISKIEKEKFEGDVFNLELVSNIKEDDLFWVEGKTGIITHNCFPKDISAIIYVAEKLGMSVPTIMGAYVTNQIVRENRDWEQMEGRAVSHREKEIDQINFQEVEADEKESNN
jgi:hypothetical protein